MRNVCSDEGTVPGGGVLSRLGARDLPLCELIAAEATCRPDARPFPISVQIATIVPSALRFSVSASNHAPAH